MPHEKTILLTGATGLLGSQILQYILEMRSKPGVLVLLRGNPSEGRRKLEALVTAPWQTELRERVEFVSGDLQRPRLGLAPRTRAAIADQLTHVIHAAASISFSMPYAEAHAINYDGTRRVYELASEARQLEAFAHISTAYVAGCRTGIIREQELSHNAGFVNNYERTKYEAEEFLRSRMSSCPISVYRTATMIGNSANGAVRQFNYFHVALRSLYLGLVPFLPGDSEYRVDIIPEDWAAEAIRYLVLDNFRAGATYHLCAGTQHALSLFELLNATFEVFAAHRSPGRRVCAVPAIIPCEAFQTIVKRANEELREEQFRQLPKAFGYFIAELTLPKVFDAEQLVQELPTRAQVPDIRTYYSKVLEFCLATDWGRAFRAGSSNGMRHRVKARAPMFS